MSGPLPRRAGDVRRCTKVDLSERLNVPGAQQDILSEPQDEIALLIVAENRYRRQCRAA